MSVNVVNRVMLFKQGEYTSGIWEEESKDIHFADFKFYITHHFLKQECEEEDVKDKAEEGTCI